MPAAIARYLIGLAALLAAYGLYALVAVPVIEPEAKYREREADESEIPAELAAAAMQRQRDEMADLFGDGDWELSSPKVLATEQGKLLFQEYQPLPDGRLELRPCTLICYVGGTAGEKRSGRPIVMRAPAGAVFQFDKPLSLGQAELGRMVGGRLLGEITISSRESRPGAGDALEIVTRNVQLDEQHIWTPHEVRFRYGESRGSGRDLTIVLVSGAKPGANRKQAPGIGGVKAIELVHVDKLHLVTSGGGLLPGGETTKPSAAPEPPLPVEVTCRGPFRFDFNKLLATFEDQVDVRRLHPSGAFDKLDCQLLEIYFGKSEKVAEKGAAAKPAGDGESKTTSTALSGMEVHRLVAVGQPVVLKAGAGGASAQGERFEYDVRNKRILLEDSRKATLLHDRHYIEARGLAYELADPGKLGRLWAAGPGRFQTGTSADGKQQFEATWEKELRLRPHQGNHVISLHRGAGLGFSGQGGIRADDIHVWLHEAPAEQSPLTTDRSPGIVPDKMLALGNVEIDSPQLTGRAPRLEAWFKSEEAGEAPLPADGRHAGPGSLAPRGARNEEALASDGPPGKTAQKFDLTGKLIQIQLVRRGVQTAAENVTVEGPVKLIELQAAGVKEPPLEMQGDVLQIFQASSTRARARMTGAPARVAARGMKLSGSNIQMNRGENRLWIEGAGEMTLPASRNPLAAMQRGGEAPRDERLKAPLASGQTITVTWQRRMNFDGQTVRFEQQVEARGQTQYARGEILDVTLTRRLDFSQAKPGDRVDVQRLAFDGGVFLENRGVEEGRLVSIEQVQARKLSLDNENGRLHAVGPGWVSSVRLGGASPLGGPLAGTLAGAKSAVRNSAGGAMTNRADDGLGYLHVDFQTALTGNLVKREVQFLDRVVAVHGPVENWEQQLSPDRAEDLPERAVLLNCDRLTVVEMGEAGPGQKLYEMEAAGNTRAEGKTFTATADRMTYAQAKDLIVLEGDGRADAELWRQSRVGGPTEHAAARKILYWHRDNRAQVDDARFLDLSQFGAPPPRKPALTPK